MPKFFPGLTAPAPGSVQGYLNWSELKSVVVTALAHGGATLAVTLVTAIVTHAADIFTLPGTAGLVSLLGAAAISALNKIGQGDPPAGPF